MVIGDCPSMSRSVGHVSDTEPLPKSNLAAVRRLEVFTGAGRRRSWSAREKERLVAESYESGETVSAVARRHALTPQQLFGWRRVARQRRDEESGTRGSAFAPVIVDAAAPCVDGSIAPSRRSGLAIIEIVIGAATVRVPPGTDVATLQAVLRVVKATL